MHRPLRVRPLQDTAAPAGRAEGDRSHLQLKLSRFGKDLTRSAAFYKLIDAEGNQLGDGGFLGADGGRVATEILNSSDYTTATMLAVGINTTDDFSGTVSLSQTLSN